MDYQQLNNTSSGDGSPSRRPVTMKPPKHQPKDHASWGLSRLACSARLDESELQHRHMFRSKTSNGSIGATTTSKTKSLLYPPQLQPSAPLRDIAENTLSFRPLPTQTTASASSCCSSWGDEQDPRDTSLTPLVSATYLTSNDSTCSTVMPVPFTERLRRAVMTPGSPSKSSSQRTHAASTCATTMSSSTAQENHHHGRKLHRRRPPTRVVRSRTPPDLTPIHSNTLKQGGGYSRPPLHTPSNNNNNTAAITPLPPSLTITTCSSFTDSDVSFLSFHHDDEQHFQHPIHQHNNNQNSNNNNNSNDTSNTSWTTTPIEPISEQQQQLQDNRQLKYWRRRCSECFEHYGMQHSQTANAFLELGLEHVRCEQYTAAQDFFRTALRVFEKLFGPNNLRVAKVLEALGMAQSRWNTNGHSSSNNSNNRNNNNDGIPNIITISSSPNSNSANKAGLLLGLQSFRRCFRIRYDQLGPTAIDTVEVLNKIANNYMRLHMYHSAKNDYMQVLTLRTAILGHDHPSVGICAQALGMAHWKQKEQEQAKAYFLQALNVFAVNGLGDHPLAQRIREDVQMLGWDLARVEI
ncbi:repeat protein [Seminavis robusta]|uniref:Repeat protein n=1 Tax=Seminavis robusta TaxID=568900 RepID=A0A9N8DA37_9STRA|nr:repeat protein [Seminavis robusta]|eukprot:Sro30_g019930.1 repeat protein (578) ;mRNA; f:158348-160246